MLRGAEGLAWERELVPSLPPPPEVTLQGAIPWYPGAEIAIRHQLPRHPLLCLAEAREEPPGRRPIGLAAAVRRIAGSLALGRGGDPSSAVLRRSLATSGGGSSSRPRGGPLMVVVAGGKGGSGASSLALDVGWVAADPNLGEPQRVLLVDANGLSPDIDLRLGAAGPEGDQVPSARLDQLLLRLAELAEGKLHLQSVLWSHPTRSLSALLAPTAPSPESAVGAEHLDYLYRYLLAPAFDLIVVDVGLLSGEIGTQARFWLGLAHRLLLPMRPADSDRRAVARSLRLVEQSCGIRRDRCRVVVGLERGQSSRRLGLDPELALVGLHPRPWVPQSAMRSEVRHLPLAELDRRVASSVRELLPDLLAAEPLERSLA